MALLALPQIPTLFVAFLPTRYTSVPYIGFLILMAAGIRQVAAALLRTLGRLAVATGCILAVFVAAAGMLTVRADLIDQMTIERGLARRRTHAGRARF
jgi:hypothetical protein